MNSGTPTQSVEPPVTRAADDSKSTEGDTPQSDVKPVDRVWRLTLLLAVAWWTTLIALVVFTANPPVLNATQIDQADYVVTGTVGKGGVVSVEKEWKHGAELGKVVLTDHAEVGLSIGQSVLVPLREKPGGDFEVAQGKIKRGMTMKHTYPANDAAIRQLTALLDKSSKP